MADLRDKLRIVQIVLGYGTDRRRLGELRLGGIQRPAERHLRLRLEVDGPLLRLDLSLRLRLGLLQLEPVLLNVREYLTLLLRRQGTTDRPSRQLLRERMELQQKNTLET